MPGTRENGERQRLVEVYASKSDAELEMLAEDGPSLTDLARDVLRAEILRRKLNIAVLELPRPTEDDADPKLVTVRRYLNVQEALLAKSLLESAGISCFLGDENTIRIDWFLPNALGGVKLLVTDADVTAANELLNQQPESFTTDAGNYAQPRCPSCGSSDLSLGATGSIDYGPLTINLPRAPTPDGWTCNACGHRWEDAWGE